jgi:hypothetical protein
MEGETRGQKCHGGQKSSLQCAIEVEKLLIYFKICTKMIDKSCRILKVLAGKKMSKNLGYSAILLFFCWWRVLQKKVLQKIEVFY